MHVRVRLCGKPEVIVSVESKLTKIDKFRELLHEKFDVKPNLQRLLYGGKLLEDGYTFHDYNIKLNDVIQLMVRAETSPEKEITASENKENDEEETKIEYEDAVSMLYAVGDLIDMRDKVYGAWFEGRIERIVRDPSGPHPDIKPEDCPNKEDEEGPNKEDEEGPNKEDEEGPNKEDEEGPNKEDEEGPNKEDEEGPNKEDEEGPNKEDEEGPNKENVPEMKQPPVNTPKNGIANFFGETKQKSSQMNVMDKTEDHLLFEVLFRGDDEEESITYCKLKDIRPRARNIIHQKDLQDGQRVMVNHNFEHPYEIGYWYDFEMSGKVQVTRYFFDLVGTIYIGPNSIPQNDTKVRLHSRMFLIEEVIPLEDRTEEYDKLMKTQTPKRSLPLQCLKCRDDDVMPCKICGCFVCSFKDLPETILLCDECNRGFHMACLKPPLTEVPEGDWYCRGCKRDPRRLVVAPGAAKQKKRQTTTSRDWGRGMACVGKTKTCPMPSNHFGPIPGIDVGMCWRFRIQLSESGVHRPPVSGIHGRDREGAYSIVLSGGYEDDVDHGNEFTYTGSGGRDLSGNKRTAGQSCDQKLARENKALARNCAVKGVNENGDDAGENWREGRPVRVMRSCKMLKHFPKYAPQQGIRYDGIYKVVKYYPEEGKSGFRVWKYLLRRDDPNPAPWEPGAKHYDIIYPDGYLEAEAEKKTLKEKNAKPRAKRQPTKRALQESNHPANEETMPLAKKPKVEVSNREAEPGGSEDREKSILSEEEKVTISMDTLNARLWEECFELSKTKGKKEFVEHMSKAFLCIICQEVAANPVTTSCLHNFCMTCLKQAFKATGSQVCPCCRNNMAEQDLGPNDRLKTALRTIMSGYDANRT